MCALFTGDIIYGRVMVDPVQNLGDSFYCSIEKVFLCTGADGYVPKYNPSNTEYGCLADSPSLLYRFKIVVSVLILGGCTFFFFPNLFFIQNQLFFQMFSMATKFWLKLQDNMNWWSILPFSLLVLLSSWGLLSFRV